MHCQAGIMIMIAATRRASAGSFLADRDLSSESHAARGPGPPGGLRPWGPARGRDQSQ